MRESWTQAARMVLAYGGSEAGAEDVAPAARVLRAALPESRVILLWPAHVRMPALMAAVTDERIGYVAPAKPAIVATGTSMRTARGAALRSVHALRASAPWGALILAEPGHVAVLPTYLCCLAGITRRAGFAAEFDGGMLTNAVRPPPEGTPPVETHLFLLEALGLGRSLAAGLVRAGEARPQGAVQANAREGS
jgi:hypothetical protein